MAPNAARSEMLVVALPKVMFVSLSAAMNTLTTSFGSLELQRYPRLSKQQLQAWDSADQYLLAQLAQDTRLEKVLDPKLSKIFNPEETSNPSLRVLIVNDSFGALTLSLAPYCKHICHWGDSFNAEKGLKLNADDNSIQLCEVVSCLPSTEVPTQPYDLVLIKLPKTTALLEFQLITISKLLSPQGQVFGSAMVKHIHSSTLSLFENFLGPSPTTKAWKKARLICPDIVRDKETQPTLPLSYHESDFDVQLVNFANVFSREKLDSGARFFIEQFATLPKAIRILDLGCGNGILGIMAKQHQAEATIDFIDESHMALASAQASFTANYPNDTNAQFIASDCLTHYPAELTPDLILCNPPFHQGYALGDDVAWKMFRQSLTRLSEHGQLWVISNRHLGYHAKLKRLFGNCAIVASNKKFVVLRATKLTKR